MSDDENDEQTKEQLREENERLRNQLKKFQSAYKEVQEYVPQVNYHPTRRDVVTSIIGGVGLYALLGKAQGQTTGSGEIASQSNPALRVYYQRAHYVDLGSDPSSQPDGTRWYNSNA